MKAWKIVIVATLVVAGLPALAALSTLCAPPRMERSDGNGCTERGPLVAVVESAACADKGVCKMPPDVAEKCGRIADARDAACSDQGMSVPGGDATCKRLGAKDARCRRCEDPESGQSYIARVDGDVIDEVRLAGGVEPKSPCELAREHWRRVCGDPHAHPRECAEARRQRDDACGGPPGLTIALDGLAQLFVAVLGDGPVHADEAPIEAKICMSTCGDDGEPGKSPWCYYVGTRFSTAAEFHCDPRQCVGAIRQDWIARRVKLPFLRMTEPDCLRACRWLSKKTATESGCDAL